MKRTRKFRILKWTFGTLSFIATYGLLLFFIIYGLASSGDKGKYIFGLDILACIVVTLISAISKRHWRTPIVLLCVGLYFVVEAMAPLLITLGISILLDELILTPIYEYSSKKLDINVEIDKRME